MNKLLYLHLIQYRGILRQEANGSVPASILGSAVDRPGVSDDLPPYLPLPVNSLKQILEMDDDQ